MKSIKKTANNKAIYLIMISTFWFVQYLLTPFLTVFLIEKGTTAFIAGVIAGAYGCVQIFIRLPIGAIADRLPDPIKVVQQGASLMIISAFLMRFGINFVMFFLARFLMGASAAVWVVIMSVYIRSNNDDSASQIIGRVTAAQYIGILSAFLIAGLIREYISMQFLLSLNVIISVLCFVLILYVRKNMRMQNIKSYLEKNTSQIPSIYTIIKIVCKNKRLIYGSILFFLSQFTVFASSLSFVTNYASDVFAADGIRISIITALFSLFTLIASITVDIGLERYISGRNAAITSFGMMALSYLILPFVNNLHWVYAIQAICGFAYGIHCSIINSFAISTVKHEFESTAMGFFQGMHCIAITTAPIVMGQLLDAMHGFAVPFIMLAVICILAMLLCGWFYTKEKVV